MLAPNPPLDGWLAELDHLTQRSPGFFVGRPTILDVASLPHDKAGLAALLAELAHREIRVMGIEGTRPSLLEAGMPPLVAGGRPTDTVEVPVPEPSRTEPVQAVPPAEPASPPKPSSLLINGNVRSGQSVFYPQGDVTVVGSVASGAEVIAGGSIHVYGALRGRAIAGAIGEADARIFCQKLQAELLAIHGLYYTADAIKPEFRDRPVQAWLADETMMMAVIG